MKKIFLFLICILSVILFSCASNDIEAVPSVDSTSSESGEAATLENETKEDAESSEINNDSLFPIPETLIEPEVITLEPAEEIETPVIEVEKTEELPEPELIVVEEPEPIIVEQEDPEENVKEEIITESDETSNKESTEKLIEEEKKEESNLTNKDTNVEENTKDTIENKEKEVTVSEEAQGDEEDLAEAEKTEESIIPSRSVTLKLKEYVDITYPGSGWIYMGAVDGAKNLTYFGRGLGTKDTTFSLQARYPGTNILHFYKNDHLTNEYLDDYIEVIILDKTGSNKTHIAAPEYKQPVPKKAKEMFYEQKQVEDDIIIIADDSETETEIESEITETAVHKKTDNKSEDADKTEQFSNEENKETEKVVDEKLKITDPNTLLKEAQLLYNEKEYKLADEKINIFLKNATKKIDEGLYLKGQILEAKSEIQNIKNAIAAYETLTKEFPASKYWDAAKKRIVYLKRFYLEVR